MLPDFFLLYGVGLGATASIMGARTVNAAKWQRELVSYELRFPRRLDANDVTKFFSTLSGLAPGKWERITAVRALVFEVVATQRGISHQLTMPRTLASAVLAQLRATLPAVTITEVEPVPTHRLTTADGIGLTSRRRLLRVDHPEVTTSGVLSSIWPLDDGEEVVVQWTISPHQPPAPVRPLTPRKTVLEASIRGESGPTDSESLRAAREKFSQPCFLALGRIGVRANGRPRRHQLLRTLTAALHSVSAPGVSLRRRRIPSAIATRRLTHRSIPLTAYPSVLNSAELTALTSFPLGDVALPGVQTSGTRQLAPSPDIPSRGRVVAEATYPGAQRPLAISVKDSLVHMHALGPTGVGKSTMLTNLIESDMRAGHGVLVLDPKSDLIRDCLDRVPKHRLRDVILVDPSDPTHSVGFDPLAGSAESPELVVDQVVGTMHSLYRASWGPRTDDVLRSALLTLVRTPGLSLCEVPLLLTDANFRRQLVSAVDDGVLKQFWSWYESLSDGDRTSIISAPLNKLRGAFLLRPRVRHLIGQESPKLDFDEVLRDGKIVLVALTKGLIGQEAAALIGSLMVGQLWQATMRRTAMDPKDRRAFFAFADEFQDYAHLEGDFADILAQARGLGLSMTLAHQHLGQLSKNLKTAVMANCRSRISFQANADDARVLAKDFASSLTAEDFQGLGKYEVIARLMADGKQAPPVTGKTLLPPPPTGIADQVREYSRQHYGTVRTDIEAAITRRQEMASPTDEPVGRERRSQ